MSDAGSKGIALLDDAGDRLRLRYVFDLADTGTRPNSRDPWLWTLEDRHGIPVKAMLERRYGTAADTLPQQLADAAGQLADATGPTSARRSAASLQIPCWRSTMNSTEGLPSSGLSPPRTHLPFCPGAGTPAENHFGAETFRNIYEFNTPATVAALGTAVSEGSREILLQIAAVVRQVERDIAEERRLGMSSMNIEYRRNGEYLIPNIEMNQPQTPLGKYGRMRRMFLKENRPVLYNHLLLSGSCTRTWARSTGQRRTAWTGRWRSC